MDAIFFYHLVLFFFPFIFISWRLITLQYCRGFCHTLTCISHGFTCIPHWVEMDAIINEMFYHYVLHSYLW